MTNRVDRQREFFSDKVCEDCGGSNNLLLHHIDPKTKVSSRIWGWSDERRSAEIAKCIVLCSSCHTKRHCKNSPSGRIPCSGKKKSEKFKHGTAGYNHGCRCDQCKLEHRNALRKYRARKMSIPQSS